jgi:hypothetical protein
MVKVKIQPKIFNTGGTGYHGVTRFFIKPRGIGALIPENRSFDCA